MKRLSIFLVGLMAGVTLIGGTSFVLTRFLLPPNFHGMVMQSQQPARNFMLTSHYGQPVSLSDYRGKVVLLYFGYGACPDVCPATLVELARARATLGKDAEKAQVLMITVDPERDTQEKLAEYITFFDRSFIGLTGTPAQIAEVATYYGIYYAKHQEETALGYLVDHTATVMLIDKEGYLRIVYPFGTPAKDFAEDLKYLVAR